MRPLSSGGGDAAQSTEHALRSKPGGQRIEVAHAVEQRQYDRSLTHCCLEVDEGLVETVGFRSEKNDVVGALYGARLHGLDADTGISELADDPKPVSFQLLARAGRSRNVTFLPASANRPPKYPPTAPAPTTSTRIILSTDDSLTSYWDMKLSPSLKILKCAKGHRCPVGLNEQSTLAIALGIFNLLRLGSYIPQIVAIARDNNGSTAISFSCWIIWVGANATTGLYA
jgi:hypothetical protein